MARETWYVLEDGSTVDPNDCAPDDGGVLRHKGGVAVAMRGGAYSSRSIEPAEMREATPAPVKSGYKTREAKAKA